MWKMARPQGAARWTRRPAPRRDSSCTRRSRATASAGSRSCTDPTATMTSHQRPCPGTPPSPVNSKHQFSSYFTLSKSFPCCSHPQSSVKKSLWVVHTHFIAGMHKAGADPTSSPIPSFKYSHFLLNLAEELSKPCPGITEKLCCTVIYGIAVLHPVLGAVP